MRAILIVVIIFSCSLGAAYVLFKLLKSTAFVKTPEGQAGGAAGGFLLVLFALTAIYSSVCKLEAGQAVTITGKIRPNLLETKVVLAVAATDPDGNGSFRVDGRCIDPSRDDIRLYFIREGRQVFRILDALPGKAEEFNVAQLEGHWP